MGRKKHAAAHGGNHERWLLTYADLITLLLIYFIILYSMSSLDVAKFRKMADALSNAFNVIPSQGGSDSSILPPGSPEVMPPVAPMYEKKETFDKVVAEIHKLVEDLEQDASGSLGAGAIDVRETSRGLVVSLADSALFEPGSAEVNPKMTKVLAKVGDILNDLHNAVRIEGHTDNRPIGGGRFPTNWELSTARATNVVRYLIDHDHLPPARLSASGYADTFPRFPNDTEEHRARNRRVDIVIVKEGAQGLEPPRQAATSGNPENRENDPVLSSGAGFPTMDTGGRPTRDAAGGTTGEPAHTTLVETNGAPNVAGGPVTEKGH